MSLPEYFQPNMYITDVLIVIIHCSKGALNSFVHETEKKLHCPCTPRRLQLTFIHFVMDLRK